MAEPEREQTNWRIRRDLTTATKVLAVELGCRPRDVVEAALELHIAALRPQPSRVQAVRPMGPPARTVAEVDPILKEPPLPLVAAATEAALREGIDPIGKHVSIPLQAGRACPECGGDLEPHPDRHDVGRCRDCGFTYDASADPDA